MSGDVKISRHAFSKPSMKALSMDIGVQWSLEVSSRFKDLAVCVGTIKNLRMEKENSQVQELKRIVYDEVKAKYDVNALKDNSTVRAYRDFYWRLGIDPTKTRPAGEALLRRILNGNELPAISNVVDAYNLASVVAVIPISGFDEDKLKPPFSIRFAKKDESFAGIGISKPMLLTDEMLVLSDSDRVLCVYPYRDSNHSRITEETKNAVLVVYGAPAISRQQLRLAMDKCLSLIKQVAGGEIQLVQTSAA